MTAEKKIKFLFLVQGEGRGHMMQALALRDLLEKMGHSVTRICLGRSRKRQIPEFFIEEFGDKLLILDSPGFVTDRRDRGVKPFFTILYNVLQGFTFLKSLRTLRKTIGCDRPDVVINFYDLLGGLYGLVFSANIPFICIGHQCIIAHSDFSVSKKHLFGRLLMSSLYKLTSYGSTVSVALSFSELLDAPEKKLYVMPPLLRESFKKLIPEQRNFILAYTTNSGYANDIVKSCNNNPSIYVRAFGDRKQTEDEYKPLENLTIFRLQGEKFRETLCTCKGVLTTAGFETVCEAAYLGKPILVVPMKNQYEQFFNALEVESYQLAIRADCFDVALIDRYADEFYASGRSHTWFRIWCDCAEERLEHILQHVLEQYP